MDQQEPEQKEAPKEPTDYRTDLLKAVFQRLSKESYPKALQAFYDVLLPGTKADSKEELTEEMFLKLLRPSLTKLHLFDAHRKLATAFYRLNSTAAAVAVDEQKQPEYSLCGASEERFASSLRFDLSPESIQSLANDIEAETIAVMDRVAALSGDDLTTENVLVPLIQLDQRLSGVESSVTILQNISPIKEVRDASQAAEVQLSKFAVEISMRKDVFKVIKAYSEKVDTSTLPTEWQRYLEFELRDYKRMGLDLEDEDYEKVKGIKKRMSEIASEFQKNLNEENTKFIFEEKELEGMPEDWMGARLIKDDGDANKGKYDVSIKYPDLFPILQKCKVAATREKMLRAHNSRCMDENAPIIEELVKLRYQQAQLLGKDTHSAHVLEIRMAKDPKTVWDFLHDLNEKMEPLAKQDMDALLALKKKEMEAANQEFDGVIHEHDFRYYCTVREETEFAIDKEVLRPYFPIQTVIDGALNIYQTLLGLHFLPIKEEESQFKFWHPEVQLYQVVDVQTKDMMGYFFLDLHPREGKYGHACMCTLQAGCRIYDDSGKEVATQYPINLMLCNFPKPTADKPSLLSHSDVETFFHEFGHVMHQICGQPLLRRFSGTRVERDFVEAPSQMLENWCWKNKSLNLMSGHYEDINKKIPEDLLEKLVKSKNANCGLLTKRQLYFGILDQTMHTVKDNEGIDTQKLCMELQPKIMGINAMEGTNFVASFGHLAGGYDAQYYGYMWSDVYSADMFYSVFCKDGDNSLLDTNCGMAYRTQILAPGGSRDAMDSLKEFLGREPNAEAFLKDKGLAV